MANGNTAKKLRRSKANKMVLGVCGGMGEYFGVDPTIIRLIAVVAAIFTGGIFVLLAYIIAAIVMPD